MRYLILFRFSAKAILSLKYVIRHLNDPKQFIDEN